MGVREVISVLHEKQPDGRIFEKMELGSYSWMSYGEIDELVNAVAKGLSEIGQKLHEKVTIFAETRQEWMITAFGCFKNGFPVATAYSTLGTEAVRYAINESEAVTLVTSASLLSQVNKVVRDCENIKRIVFFAHQDPKGIVDIPGELRDHGIQIIRFEKLIDIGKASKAPFNEVSPDDLALIMYTSGTTGNPKGVMISHRNIITTSAGQASRITVGPSDTVIGYLPLAHILEVCAELAALTNGCRIGYSSPLTLFDGAPKIKKGQIGDCRVLKPTLMACVPAVLDRIFKMVIEHVNRSGAFGRELFRICYERKRSRYEEGYSRSLLDLVTFNRIRQTLGGELRLLLSGGAPLNPETQRFMNICFCCPVIQGYGLTETCSGGTLGDPLDLSTGTVGAPIYGCEIILKEWEEAGYSPYNETPQGEILIGGNVVSLGYYKNPEKTAEDFVIIDGKRWFATGDIGEFRSDGSLSIIDRKKDLLKLSHGEYISPGKVETTILTSPYIDNIYVHGDSKRDFLVALVVPNHKNLLEVAQQIGLESQDISWLCKQKEIIDEYLSLIKTYCTDKLYRAEIPQRIYLCPEAWTSASGLLTEALKLRRKNIEKKFSKEIRMMYI
ncbi:hypothetical protein AB6A40_000652 [Gnathostoma spinigerum]|uniref:long-chain-fatty-acid--CoA ligase n=1 Tax=Gnathostoma spinigerum TaxID=75299 RepID=A0ABD6E2H6_9BILA